MTLPYIAGMTWGWTGVRGTWKTPEADFSMSEMVKLGVNWTAIAFSAYQDHPQATEVKFREDPTVTDEEVLYSIKKAQSMGLKIVLKPVVNCTNGVWRAHINFFDMEVPGEPSWGEWFASYREFILHYAKMAEETGCEMFCVGCEMVQTDRREQEWRQLIADVRKVYSGLITYNCDKYQEDHVKWWDAVDVISSSGYYPAEDWEEQLDRIDAAVSPYNKPFFFMEAGCPSREGSAKRPNDWNLVGAPSEKEQDEYYKAMFGACEKRDWVRGFMLWDWPAKLYGKNEAAANDDYCMYAKQAEATVTSYYVSKTALQEVGE
ncbi:1,4-beta-xylanase [Paenibacillus sp. NEAU-GSW1]|uniref:glycoside hydrolase family 113 n=1 Tax=Paenibacillus sp. NEAU-GSW1 TaxID=2682486 RepID=UPI0012E130A1|nr:1,4-beta-xylanase [Paenibacillus sp. NEAU-GSW1]MUT66612.1 1,4-beta-xylanase [Paenibacillus sp. NEAU-GSW1]